MCVLCAGVEAEPVLQRKDRLGAGIFHYVRCAQCGLIRLEPRPSLEERIQHYPPAYEAFQVPRQNWLHRLGQRRYWSRRVQAVRGYLELHHGEVLDVGCATGGFLIAMQKRGWQTAGIEPHQAAAARVSARLGPKVVRAIPLEEAAFASGSFDLITLWDVLDHLQNPLAALRKMSDWLRPTGLLVVGVPNPDSWDARLFGPAWLGWDAPRHLYVFPDRTLRAMVAAAGLQVIADRCFYGGHGSFVASLDLCLRERWGDKGLARLLRCAVHLRLWRYVLWPTFRLAEGVGRGAIRTYFCRPAPCLRYEGRGLSQTKPG